MPPPPSSASISQPLRFCTGYPAIPRFLLPRLHDPEPNFASQIDDIVRSTALEIGRDLSATVGPEPPDQYRPFIDRPRQALEEVARALDAYHKAAIAPRWPAMGDRMLMLTLLVCDPSGVIADLGDMATVKIGYAASCWAL